MAGAFDLSVFDWSAFEATPGFFLDAEIRLNKAFRIDASLCSKFTVNATILGPRPGAFTVNAFIHTLTYAQVSQVPLEVLVRPTDGYARVSQAPLEVLVRPTDTSARASQVVIEVLVLLGVYSIPIDAVIFAPEAHPSSFTTDATFIPARFRVDAVIGGASASSFLVNAYIEGVQTYDSFTINAVIFATVGPSLRSLVFPGTSRTLHGLTANALSPAFPINAGERAVVVVVSAPSDGGDLGIASTTAGYLVPVTVGEHDVVATPGSYYVVSSKDNVYRPSLTGSGSYKDWGVSTLRFSVDAFVRPTFTIDARFCWTFAFSFTLAATIKATHTSTFSTNAFVLPYFRVDAIVAARRFHLDAWIKAEFHIDAWVIRLVSSTFSVNAYLKPSFTINAILFGTRQGAFSVGAFKTAPHYGSFGIEAWILGHFTIDAAFGLTKYRTFVVSTWLVRHVESSFTMSSYIRPHLNIDATIRASSEFTFTTDAWTINPKYGSFELDAFILGTLWVNAVLAKTATKTADVDAAIVFRPVGSFSMDASITGFCLNAVLKVTQQGIFMFNALYGLMKQAGSFTINAEKRDPGAYWDPITETWMHLHFLVDAFFKVLPHSSFTVKAAIIYPGQPIYSLFFDASIAGTPPGSFTVEAEISTLRTVVFEGYGDVTITVLHTVAERLSFPGISTVLPDGSAGDNVLFGPFWPPDLMPVTLTVWGDINVPNTAIGVVSANENLWARPYPTDPAWAQGPGQITVVRDNTITITLWPSYYFEPYYVYAYTDGTYKPSMTGDALLTYYKHDTVVFSRAAPTIDAWIVGTIGEPFTLDAEIVGTEKLGLFTLSADLSGQGEKRGTLSIDAQVRSTLTYFFFVEATFAAWGFTVDATFWQPCFTIDAFIQPVFPTDAIFLCLGGSVTQDVALEKTVTTSSTVAGTDAEIVDGDDLTSHYSSYPVTGNWVEVDLGAPYLISSYRLYQPLASQWRASAVTLEYWDGSNWIVAWTDSGLGADNTRSIMCPVAAQLWRIRATAGGGSGWQVNTLSLYNLMYYHVFALDYQWILPTKVTSFLVSAEIVVEGDRRGLVTLDALVLSPRVGRFYLAADLRMLSAAFSVDALISPWFGVEAWISPVGGGLGGFSVGAYVRGSSYIIFPDDGGVPTDPLGNPPALSRKFRIKIEAGFPGPLAVADPYEVIDYNLDALLCIPESERLPAEVAEIARLRELIAEQDLRIAAALAKDPSNQWLDRLAHVAQDILRYQAIHSSSRTPQQVDALRRAWDSYYYATTMYRRSRTPQKTWVDITGDCIWSGTDFTQAARTGPGSFTITLKGAHNEFKAGEEIHFEIDDLRVFGGWVTDVERGYFFSDYAQPKTVLHGTDYNILFDRLVIRNYPWEFANYGKTGQDAGPYRSWPAFKKGTLDSAMIRAVFSRYVAPDLPPEFDYTTGVDPISTPAPVSPWVMPEAGSTLRMFMQSVSQITTGVWCIDPHMVLQYHDRGKETAPYPLTDGLGGISSRALSVTTDISQMMNDVLVWGTLAKNIEGQILVFHEEGDGKWWERYWISEINRIFADLVALYDIPPGDRTDAEREAIDVYKAQLVIDKARLEYVRTHVWDPDSGDPRPPDAEIDSIGHWGRWQYGEFREEIHHNDWLRKRGHSILVRFDEPIMRATATVWDPGYQAGQVVNVKSSVYKVDINLVIRSLHISFTVPKEPLDGVFYALPQYDLEMGLDPEAPWNIYDFLPYPGQSTAGVGMDTTGG